MGQGLIIEALRSHSGTQHSVALLWTSGQHSRRTALQETVTHAPQRDSNPQSQQVNSRRVTSSTARPLGSAYYVLWKSKFYEPVLPSCGCTLTRESKLRHNSSSRSRAETCGRTLRSSACMSSSCALNV